MWITKLKIAAASRRQPSSLPAPASLRTPPWRGGNTSQGQGSGTRTRRAPEGPFHAEQEAARGHHRIRCRGPFRSREL